MYSSYKYRIYLNLFLLVLLIHWFQEPLTSYSKALFDKRIEGGKNVDNLIVSLEISGTILLVAVQENSKIILLDIRSLLSASTKDCDIPVSTIVN